MRRPLVVLAAAAVLLTACGGAKHASDSASTSAPTSASSSGAPTASVSMPAGVALTASGTQLRFGQPATVAFEPNSGRTSVLRVTVRSVVHGSVADLRGYVLDARTRSSSVYYVTADVANVGGGEVGGTQPTLWAVGPGGELVHASTITSYARCPSTALPSSFGAQATTRTCLLYLLPDHGTLSALSWRSADAKAAAVTWTGRIQTARQWAAAQKAAKKAAQKAAQKKAAKKGAAS